MSKPKCAAEKKNKIHIRYEVRQSVLKKLGELHYKGGAISLLDDSQIADLATHLTWSVMRNEKIDIILKRRK